MATTGTLNALAFVTLKLKKRPFHLLSEISHVEIKRRYSVARPLG